MADILNRIRKLVELSKNNTSPEEAANAAARAQELMFKYQIGEADLDVGSTEREVEPVVDEIVHAEKGRRDAWKASLANGIAKAFGARVYTVTGGTCDFHCVGLKSVTQTVQYMFGYLVLEVDRLADEGWTQEPNRAHHNGRTWKNNFRLGAVAIIVSRLKEQRAQQERQVEDLLAVAKEFGDAATGSKSTALALYKTDQERQAEGYEEIKKKQGLRPMKSKYTYNPNAYQRGRSAGESVSLTARGAGLPGAKSRIGE